MAGGRGQSLRSLNDKPTAAREGLQAMAADADGHVAMIWLDDRDAPAEALWGAFSNDAGATWSRNVMLYASPERSICECCHPSLLALFGHGEFAAMWRNAVGGSRDFYVMRLRDGKPVSGAVKQGQGTWKLEACPMDGGGIAVRDGQIASAWRREHDVDPGRARRAQSRDRHRAGPGVRQCQGLLRGVEHHRRDLELHAPGSAAATPSFERRRISGDGRAFGWWNACGLGRRRHDRYRAAVRKVGEPIRRFLPLILLLAGLSRLMAADTARDSRWLQDLDTLTAQLPALHPNLFFQTPRSEFDRAAADLRAAIPDLNDAEVMVGLARITALPRDRHTNLSLSQRNSVFHFLPLQASLV